MPLQVVVIHHPDFKDPLVLGTPLLALEAHAMPAPAACRETLWIYGPGAGWGTV